VRPLSIPDRPSHRVAERYPYRPYITPAENNHPAAEPMHLVLTVPLIEIPVELGTAV